MRPHPMILYEALTDSSTLGVFALGVFVVYYSCVRAVFAPLYRFDSHARAGPGEKGSTLSWRCAALIPIFGSVTLLLLYYLNQYFELAMCVALAVASALFLYATIYPHAKQIEKLLPLNVHTSHFTPIVSFFVTVFVTSRWLVTSSWVYLNVLSLCLVVFLVCTVRLPSGKSAALLLGLFLLYDIFWVLISPVFFRNDVMEEVADQHMPNPLQRVAETLSHAELDLPAISPPIRFEVPSVEMPGEVAVLGLADVAIPAMFGAYSLAFDMAVKKSMGATSTPVPAPTTSPSSVSSTSVPVWLTLLGGPLGTLLRLVQRLVGALVSVVCLPVWGGHKSIARSVYGLHFLSTYFGRVLCGFVVGLLCAVTTSLSTNTAQPVLMYVVPGIFAPAMMLARRRGHLLSFWNGMILQPKQDSHHNHHNHHHHTTLPL